MQRAVRPATLIEDAPIFTDLLAELSTITLIELRVSILALRAKASGPDRHPLEFGKAAVDSPGPDLHKGAAWLFKLCNRSWLGARVPENCFAAGDSD